MDQLLYFENTYGETPEDLNNPDTMGAVANRVIDGYPKNDSKEGRVVCRIWLTKTKDFIVDWHDNGYRMNKTVLELIENSKQQLLETYFPESEKHECVEVCPHCEFENTIQWDVEKDGYEVECKECGKKIMLCDECQHADDNKIRRCDWSKETGCFRKPKKSYPTKNITVKVTFSNDAPETGIFQITVPINVTATQLMELLEEMHKHLDEAKGKKDADIYNIYGRTPKTLVGYLCKEAGWNCEELEYRMWHSLTFETT